MGEDGLHRMPVVVLTHRPHKVIVKGETPFSFVTEGIRRAVELAAAAAGSKTVHSGIVGCSPHQVVHHAVLQLLQLRADPDRYRCGGA